MRTPLEEVKTTSSAALMSMSRAARKVMSERRPLSLALFPEVMVILLLSDLMVVSKAA